MEKKTKDLRVFGIAMAAVLTGIGIWQFLLDRPLTAGIFSAVAAAFLTAAVLLPRALLPIFVPWMKVGFSMGYVMTRVILTVFYFLVITPFALVRRLLGKDSLERNLDGDAATWWRERNGEPPPPERYERQF